MSCKLEKLTPEQEALIPIIRDEWTHIALDTSPINQGQAEAAIQGAYKCAGLQPPQQILWFDNPLAAINWIAENSTELVELIDYSVIPDSTDNIVDVDAAISACVDASVMYRVKRTVYWGMDNAIANLNNILRAIWYAPDGPCWWQFPDESYNLVEDAIEGYANGPSQASELAYYAYFQAIGVQCPKIEGLQATVKYCGFWWAFETVAAVTPKPLEMHFDSDRSLHALCEPAVRYQGFNVYAYHGTILPPEYGTVHPTQWKAEWLLAEPNAELRRVLIQGIGYARLLEELLAVELDSWREYVLLKIDADADVEPIVLLKMTCPSTGHIHILRVPPKMRSARKAICWVNWDNDPEDFAVQT